MADRATARLNGVKMDSWRVRFDPLRRLTSLRFLRDVDERVRASDEAPSPTPVAPGAVHPDRLSGRVQYFGFFNEPTGYGAAARAHLLALVRAGVQVRARAVRFDGLQRVDEPLAVDHYPELAALDRGEDSHHDTARDDTQECVIVHTPPTHYPALRQYGASNIGVMAWETDRVPDGWGAQLDLMHEIWVPSEFCRECVAPFTRRPIRVIPHPVAIHDGPKERSPFPGVADDSFAFVSIQQWSDRKNPMGLVRAFVRAFRGRRDVCLLLKLGWRVRGATHTRAAAELFAATAGAGPMSAPPVFVIADEVSSETIERLYRRADCYVSLHRSEGFGLTLAEAMARRVPVIATGYSGNLQFQNEQNSMLVKHRLVAVKQRLAQSWFDTSMQWAEPDPKHAIQLLREAVHQRHRAREMAEIGHRQMAQQLAPQIVGERMLAALRQTQSASA